MQTVKYLSLKKGQRFFVGWLNKEEVVYLTGSGSKWKRYCQSKNYEAINNLLQTAYQHVRDGYKPSTSDLVPDVDTLEDISIELSACMAVETQGLKGEHLDCLNEQLLSAFEDVEIVVSETSTVITIIDKKDFLSIDYGNMPCAIFDQYSQEEKELVLEKGMASKGYNNPNGDGRLHFHFGETRISAILLVMLKQMQEQGLKVSAWDCGFNLLAMEEPWVIFSDCTWYSEFIAALESTNVLNSTFIGSTHIQADITAWL